MFRLIIFVALVLLLYWLLQKASRRAAPHPPPGSGPRDDAVDELVQDPVCGVYHPKRRALVLRQAGKTYYFCSKNCLELFKKGGDGR